MQQRRARSPRAGHRRASKMLAGLAAGLLGASALACSEPAAVRGRDGAAEAAQALEVAQELEQQLAALQGAVEARDETVARMKKRIARLAERLAAASAEAERVRAAAKSDLDERAAALEASIAELERRLEILTERYDYHLSRYHGGN